TRPGPNIPLRPNLEVLHAESDPEEDPKEYEDDETEDGPVDYPMDREDDGDDNDSDSSGDDADDEDEDKEEDEEEHLAPTGSAVVIPTDELLFPPKGTKPVIPPCSTDTTTTGAMIIVRLQAVISFPPEAEVERLLAMPTSSPSPLASLSPPSAGERLARCTAPDASPLPPPLHMPPPADRRDDILETEMPPRKRLCLSTLGSRYEVKESSIARPTKEVGYGIKDAWIDPTETVPKIAPMTVGEDSRTRISQRVDVDSQRVDLLMKDMIAHQETIQIVKDEAYVAREAWAHLIGLSQAVYFELQTHQELASDTDGRDSPSDGRHETRDGRHAGRVPSIAQIMAPATRQGPSTLPNNTNPNNITQESVQAMIDQALLRNSTNGDESHSLHEDNRRNVQTARPCFYADFMKCQPLNFKGTEGVVKFATCTLLDDALTWWNNQIRSLGPDAYSMTWEVRKKKMTDKLPDNIYGSMKASKPKTLDETIELANDLMDRNSTPIQKGSQTTKERLMIHLETTMVTNTRPPKGKMSPGGTMGVNPKGNGCFECGAPGYFKRDCPKLKNKDGGKVNAPGWVYAVGNAEKRENASRDPDSNVVTSTFLLNNCYASIIFDTGADRSFISTAFSSLI
nr:hypothetical protein [Tanacetum cinerariifolium]